MVYKKRLEGVIVDVLARLAAKLKRRWAMSVGNGQSQSVTPAPVKPVGFGVVAGDAEAVMTWNDPSDASITKWQYKVKVGVAAYGDWSDMTGSSAGTTTYTVDNLTNNTVYKFKIRAVGSGGDGAESDEVTVTPTAPAVPLTKDIYAAGADAVKNAFVEVTRTEKAVETAEATVETKKAELEAAKGEVTTAKGAHTTAKSNALKAVKAQMKLLQAYVDENTGGQ